MKFIVLTLFPEMVEQAVSYSVLGKAIEKGILTIEAIDIRDFSQNKHLTVDDYPFGGGAGMVMQAVPVYEAYQEALKRLDGKAAPCV